MATCGLCSDVGFEDPDDVHSRNAKKRSDEIDKMLADGKKDWKRKQSMIHKLLLLGAGESGKSTIVRQMKIIHVNGFSRQEREEKVLHIKRNIRDSIKSILDGMQRLGMEFEGGELDGIAVLKTCRDLTYIQRNRR